MFRGFLKAVECCTRELEPGSVMDVGCGEGRVLRKFVASWPEARFFAVDLTPDIVESEILDRVHFTVQSAEDLAFAPETFDFVSALEVLEHLHSPEEAMAGLRRIVRRDVLLSVPREPIWRILNMARFAYLRDLGNTPGHLQHWSSRQFERLVARYFDIVRVERPLPWTVILARRAQPR